MARRHVKCTAVRPGKHQCKQSDSGLLQQVRAQVYQAMHRHQACHLRSIARKDTIVATDNVDGMLSGDLLVGVKAPGAGIAKTSKMSDDAQISM